MLCQIAEAEPPGQAGNRGDLYRRKRDASLLRKFTDGAKPDNDLRQSGPNSAEVAHAARTQGQTFVRLREMTARSA